MDCHSRRKPETANRRSRQIKTVLKIFRRFELGMRSASFKLAGTASSRSRRLSGGAAVAFPLGYSSAVENAGDLRHARYSVVYLAVDKYESAVIVRLVE